MEELFGKFKLEENLNLIHLPSYEEVVNDKRKYAKLIG